MIPVSSSTLRAVGYEPERRILRLIFSSGITYDYFAVPLSVYDALMSAVSKGRFFNTRIRDRYRCRRMPRQWNKMTTTRV
ncbi:MAG TPA: KTSC domain-containing protein [Ferrovibrio sp.]|uniref:KTSC domain-containing protein n=1 Tax=Ferrovibrio sp. TaxID=1917215 RepID=UPI002ED3F68A